MRSLRRRLLLGIGVTTSVAFLVAGVLVYVLARAALMEQLDDSVAARATSMAAMVEQDEEGLESELDHAISFDGEPTYFVLMDATGKVISRSQNLGGTDLAPTTTRLATVTLPDGAAARQVTITFVPRLDEPVAAPQRATLVVAGGTASANDAVRRISFVLLGVGIAGTLACLLASLWLVRFGLAPVNALAERIAQIRESDLCVRLRDAATPTELLPIVDRLNDLLARLSAAFARERELTADVAHELRTPIAGLRATIEVALDRERPAERYRSTLADCLAITLQTERMVAAMLQLARLDAGTTVASKEPIALDELVREVIAGHSPRAAERGMSVQTSLAPVSIATDREHLRVVVHNLIDNAVTYADAGSTIEIAVEPGMLRVANTGCTLAPSDAALVFERFWRGDAARSGGGAGLGLPLCRKLVALLGGTIQAAVDDGRFVVTVAFGGHALRAPT